MSEQQNKTFFQTLFDFSFSGFISIELIRVLYMISILMAGIAVIAGILAAFSNSFGVGIGAILLAPVIFLVYVLFSRVLFEVFIVIFKIADSLEEIAENTAKSES